MEKMKKKYFDALKSVGSDKSNLLGILSKAIHHSDPSTYSLMIYVKSLQGGYFEDIMGSAGYRTGLIARHMTDVQRALKEIYEVAKSKNYKDITDIFERDYQIGHPAEKLAGAMAELKEKSSV